MRAASHPSGIGAGRPSAPANPAVKSGSGALNGRAVASAPASSQRISRNSSWWSALTQGGFRGLRRWIVRTRQDRGLSIAERNAKPATARNALDSALKANPANSPTWAASLEARLKDAAWYGVDLEQAVIKAFSEMTSADLTALHTACQKNRRLAWIAEKAKERQAADLSLQKQLKQAVEVSMALSANGFSMGTARQKTLWSAMNAIFDASPGCNLEETAADTLIGANTGKLLHFAKPPHDAGGADAAVLSAVRTRAYSELKTRRDVSGSSLSDRELALLSGLVEHDDLKHLAPGCTAETTRRENIAKRNQLASYFDARLSKLAGTSGASARGERGLFVGLPYPELPNAEVKAIVADVIAKAEPALVLKVAELTSASRKDQLLINAAKEQLNKPVVASLDHGSLVAYLKLPQDSISPHAHALLEMEAARQAEQARATGMNILEEGLASGSYRRLVGAVLEFATLDRLKTRFRDAAGIDVSAAAEQMPNYFSTLDQYKILDLRHLAIELERQRQADAAHRLHSFISRLEWIKFEPLSLGEAQRMQEAVSHFSPKTGAGFSRLKLEAVNEEISRRYFSALLDSHYDEDLQKKASSGTGDLPVCIQFEKDQRNRCVRIESTLVDGYSLTTKPPSNVQRTREFVMKMRGKKFSDAQIMMASRIACQNSANLLASLMTSQKICALTDAERKQAGDAVDQIGNVGLMPAQLESDANILKNPDGSMTVDLQIFQDNTASWFGIDPNDRIDTDPASSSFSTRLKFVVDEKGELVEGDSTFEMVYRRKIK